MRPSGPARGRGALRRPGGEERRGARYGATTFWHLPENLYLLCGRGCVTTRLRPASLAPGPSPCGRSSRACRPSVGLAGPQFGPMPIPPPPHSALNFVPQLRRRLPPRAPPSARRTAAAARAAATEHGASPPPNATSSEPAQTGSDWEIPSRFSFQPMAPRSVWKPQASAQRAFSLVPSDGASRAACAIIGRTARQFAERLGGVQGAIGGEGRIGERGSAPSPAAREGCEGQATALWVAESSYHSEAGPPSSSQTAGVDTTVFLLVSSSARYVWLVCHGARGGGPREVALGILGVFCCRWLLRAQRLEKATVTVTPGCAAMAGFTLRRPSPRRGGW